MTPEPITIDGRSGMVLYIDQDWHPVEPADAALARVLFDDGSTAFYRVAPLKTAEYDESQHPRDEKGQWADSQGQLSSGWRGQTGTPEFKAWFGKSKAVSTLGRPLVLYHGTRADVTEFRRGKDAAAGSGIYLAQNPDKASAWAGVTNTSDAAAKQYGYTPSSPTGAKVLPVYAKIENPYRVDINDSDSLHYAKSGQAERDGYDGLHIPQVGEWVAFHPTQIKSAIGNRGTFDPKNPLITAIAVKKLRPENAVHAAADAHAPAIQKVIGTALDAGRAAVDRPGLRRAVQTGNRKGAALAVAGAVAAIRTGLTKTLPGVLLDALTAGGQAGVGLLAQRRTARAAGGPGSGNFGHSGGEGGPGNPGGSGAARPEEARHSEIDRLHTVVHDRAIAISRARGGIDSEYDMRSNAKAQIVEDLGDRLAPLIGSQGLVDTRALVQEKLDQWAESSGDSNPDSIRMQRVVNEEFELTDAATSHLGTTITVDAAGKEHASQIYVHNFAGEYVAQDRAYVRAEYENTQTFLRAEGIDHVSLYRGMSFNGWTTNSGMLKDGQMEQVEMQPASSWSTDFNTAYDFAADHQYSTVMTIRVPSERVLSTAVTGRGCLHEQEVLLLGGKANVRMFRAAGRKETQQHVMSSLR